MSVCVLADPSALAAQDSGDPAGPAARATEGASPGRLLAPGHWSYRYVERLARRGRLPGIDPLARPLPVAALRSALAELDTAELEGPEAAWVRLLRQAFEQAGGDPGIEAELSAFASTSRRPEPLFPTRAVDGGLVGAGVWPAGRLAAWSTSGPFLAEAGWTADTWLLADDGDPDGPTPGTDVGYPDHAYASLAVPLGRLDAGRLVRAWTPLGTPGILLSDGGISFPQVGLSLETGPVTFDVFTGRLDEVAGRRRYLAGHRLAYHRDDFAVALSELIVYSSDTDRPLLRFLNPVEFLFFDNAAAPDDVVNSLDVQAMVWYRRGRGRYVFDFVLDDIDVTPVDPDRAPLRFAALVGGAWTLASYLDLEAEYEVVSSFAYRTFSPRDVRTYLGRGTGRNFSDFDRLTIALWGYRGLLSLAPTVEIRRQGEGSPRLPFPPSDEFRASPTLFLGVREDLYRLAVKGDLQAGTTLSLTWDVGWNHVRDAGHVEGRTRNELAGTVALSALFAW